MIFTAFKLHMASIEYNEKLKKHFPFYRDKSLKGLMNKEKKNPIILFDYKNNQLLLFLWIVLFITGVIIKYFIGIDLDFEN
ncbi:MAG: hypothetical protein R2728_07990 [Chitinophagales bacterium]